jgi:hypothetical protein
MQISWNKILLADNFNIRVRLFTHNTTPTTWLAGLRNIASTTDFILGTNLSFKHSFVSEDNSFNLEIASTSNVTENPVAPNANTAY